MRWGIGRPRKEFLYEQDRYSQPAFKKGPRVVDTIMTPTTSIRSVNRVLKAFFPPSVILLAVAGCGIITHGTSQNIACTTMPAGAVIKSADGTTCTTPCTFTLKRKRDDLLTIGREGYETVTLSVRSVLSASSAGNVLLPGGFVFWGIDIVSGAGYRLVPDRVDVKLKPVEGGGTLMPLLGGVGL